MVLPTALKFVKNSSC